MAKEIERKIIHLNTTNWNDIVVNSDIPVLVDFWAEWCGPCRMVGPIVEQLAQLLDGKVKVSKLNVDQNQEIAMKYNVQSIPSLILFKNGNEVARTIGLSPKEKYEKFVNNALNS
ncbi:MAG TPA: thioredoxin [Nitrososphaeraceae archaeon]|jgi:thioredoxin 1|nr:thioredoxin [Nitrososphaeraceae archaeon]